MNNNNNDKIWQTKLHARLHDPAEKALVLLRDPAGHEGGNSRVLWRLARHDEIPAEAMMDEAMLDNDNDDVLHAVAFSDGIKQKTYDIVQRADWWAAAADRPQWPIDETIVTTKKGEQKTLKVAPWSQVSWTKNKNGENNTVLIHPLTGDVFTLPGGLAETDIEDIKARAFTHLSKLLMRDNGVTDFKKTTLAMWRFGPELSEESDNGKLGVLWNLLPADTRIPDHSIWDHLDLTSAFAGAFAGDAKGDAKGEATLLSLSIGPVQPFIASARKMDDLWAGSHLLAQLSWEAMKVVCERLGPDAILFPRLRGIPQVDLWLRNKMDLPKELFANCEWNQGSTDANPLFSAALPNRFVALVPASQAKEIAETIQKNVRDWLKELGDEVVTLLLTEAGYTGEQENHTTPYEQMQAQLQGFPEVHWAAVPFSLITCGDEKKQRDLDISQLSASMRPFFSGEGEPGFLSSPAWKVLQKELELVDEHGKKSVFFAPNPGVLYPAVFDLAERVMAAAKASHTFEQTTQHGWRCSLTGENEWLTTDRKQLHWNKTYREKQGTLWTAIATNNKSWAKKGEHLSALPAIKRLWPTLFKNQVSEALAEKDDGSIKNIDHFVVSTHTMVLAHQLLNNLQTNINDELKITLKNHHRVALPRKLAKAIHDAGQDINLFARIPGWLEDAREQDDDKAFEEAQKQLKDLFGCKAETYYSLIMMDGDKMGAILSGDDETGTTISYQQSFHPKVQKGFAERATKHPQLHKYGQQKRAITPNRHLTISAALNDFSQILVRHVVEEEHLGRLIYAGGDDVLAMLPVADLLPAMQRLRYAYSGTLAENEVKDWQEFMNVRQDRMRCKNGFAYLNKKLMRMMGRNATASCGAIIAHHQAPLSAVLRELRMAESRAKNAGGRNAFSLTVVKRSGGALFLTEKWGEPVKLLEDMRDFLASEGVSRRAVYHTLEWLNENELPASAFDTGMAHSLLTYQFDRQANGEAKHSVPMLADRLIRLAQNWSADERIKKLRNFLSVAEFLARETRTGEQK